MLAPTKRKDVTYEKKLQGYRNAEGAGYADLLSQHHTGSAGTGRDKPGSSLGGTGGGCAERRSAAVDVCLGMRPERKVMAGVIQ